MAESNTQDQGNGGMSHVPPAIEELQIELAKTGVISDDFKNYILHMCLRALEEALSTMSPGSVEQEALRQEFLSRRFSDKSRVKLNAQSLASLGEQCFHGVDSGKFLGEFFDRYFPDPHDAFMKLLLGTYDEVVSVREWLWREIDENPGSFCDVEKLYKDR